jgi:hypothetical protein
MQRKIRKASDDEVALTAAATKRATKKALSFVSIEATPYGNTPR